MLFALNYYTQGATSSHLAINILHVCHYTKNIHNVAVSSGAAGTALCLEISSQAWTVLSVEDLQPLAVVVVAAVGVVMAVATAEVETYCTHTPSRLHCYLTTFHKLRSA